MVKNYFLQQVEKQTSSSIMERQLIQQIHMSLVAKRQALNTYTIFCLIK